MKWCKLSTSEFLSSEILGLTKSMSAKAKWSFRKYYLCKALRWYFVISLLLLCFWSHNIPGNTSAISIPKSSKSLNILQIAPFKHSKINGTSQLQSLCSLVERELLILLSLSQNNFDVGQLLKWQKKYFSNNFSVKNLVPQKRCQQLFELNWMKLSFRELKRKKLRGGRSCLKKMKKMHLSFKQHVTLFLRPTKEGKKFEVGSNEILVLILFAARIFVIFSRSETTYLFGSAVFHK